VPVRSEIHVAISIGIDQQCDSRRASAAAPRRDEKVFEAQLKRSA